MCSPGIGLYSIAMESKRYIQVGSDMQLRRVNKQVHKEASDVLYKENAFHFRLFDKRMIPMNDAPLPYWRIPWQPSRVTKLCVELRCSPANLRSVNDLQFLPVHWGNLQIFLRAQDIHNKIANKNQKKREAAMHNAGERLQLIALSFRALGKRD
jgi:hypothetical protein